METAALRVGGVTPFTTLDFPGRLAAVVFVQGCPWRCGYCHNPHLQPREGASHEPWQDVMALLRKRAGLLDGVVFSGGEATIDPALADAMRDVRALGLEVGLHTACIYPRRLAEVLPLVDWVGFDIKAPFADYERITGVAGSGAPARECLESPRYVCGATRRVIHALLPYRVDSGVHPTVCRFCRVGTCAHAVSPADHPNNHPKSYNPGKPRMRSSASKAAWHSIANCGSIKSFGSTRSR